MKFKKLFITAGLSAAALGGLVGCGNSSSDGQIDKHDFEKSFKVELETEGKILNEIKGTGTKLYAFDLANIDTARKSDENYLVLSGEIISDIQNGRQKGAVVYTLSEANYDLAKEIKPTYVDAICGGGEFTADSAHNNPNMAYQLYGANSILALQDIIEHSTLYSVKNIDTNELLYSTEKEAKTVEVEEERSM